MGLKHAKEVLLFNDLEIGLLEHVSSDMFWHYGRFHALPDFAHVAGLFSRLEQAWSDEEAASGDSATHERLLSIDALDVQEEPNCLGLKVRSPQGTVYAVTDFKIANGQYEFKYDHTSTDEA